MARGTTVQSLDMEPKVMKASGSLAFGFLGIYTRQLPSSAPMIHYWWAVFLSDLILKSHEKDPDFYTLIW